MAKKHAKEGYLAEEQFVIKNNKLKNIEIINKILQSENNKPDNFYFIKVYGNKYSKIAKRKVSPKSDVYLIKASINSKFLEDKKFLLTENDIENIEYKIINNSGISIKKENAKTIQYQKFSANSFEVFLEKSIEGRILGAGASLYVMNKNEIECKNINKVLKNWEIDLSIFKDYYKEFIDDIEKDNIFLERNKNKLIEIKKKSKSRIKEIIINNSKLQEIIFFGKHNFEEPYIAHWIYKNSQFNKNQFFDFTIDAGSGRKTIDIGGTK